MHVPTMMDIRNNAVRRTVLVMGIVPAVLICMVVEVCVALTELVKELPGAIETVWRKQ